jgi:hypothetical protein
LGSQTCVVHSPLQQSCKELEQSIPPGTNPEPSALHVVATFPVHTGSLGAHTFAAQVAVLSSQYCAVVHVAYTVDVSPFALHWCTALPLQNRSPGTQTTSAQAPATQTSPAAPQSLSTVCDRPSAAHFTASSSSVQNTNAGVQLQLLQEAASPDALQLCCEEQGLGAS